MTPDEIRAEVERRKQRAKDLKIREVLWWLQKTFRSYPRWVRDDPQFAKRLIYPGIEPSESETRFSLGQVPAKLIYAKSKARSSSGDYGDTDRMTGHSTLTLKLNDESVFEFEIAETTTFGHFEPVFREHLDEITKFIDGPWISEIGEFAKNVKAYEEVAWKERNAPREAQEAEDLRKRFGL